MENYRISFPRKRMFQKLFPATKRFGEIQNHNKSICDRNTSLPSSQKRSKEPLIFIHKSFLLVLLYCKGDQTHYEGSSLVFSYDTLPLLGLTDLKDLSFGSLDSLMVGWCQFGATFSSVIKRDLEQSGRQRQGRLRPKN